jgi:multiple sugar transport system substrate-binding protein
MPAQRDHTTGNEIVSLGGDAGAGSTLHVAVYPSIDQTVLRTMALWKALHPDVAVRLTSRPMHDHHRAMAEVLANGVDVPDVIGIEVTYMSRFAALGGLEDLSQAPYRGDEHVPRLAPHALPAARSATGALLALPADIGPGVLFYRQDLLDRAGVAAAELVGWDGLVAAGRRLRAETNVALVSHVALLADLRSRAGIPPGEGLYFDPDGAPRLRSERFQAGLELAREARAAGIDAREEAEWRARWQSLVAAGLVAAHPAGPWMLGMLEGWIAPGTRGAWRTLDLPAGVRTGFGGSYYALPKRSPNRAVGWDWVKLMCLDRRAQLLAFEHAGAFPALAGALDDALLDEPLPFLGGQRARRQWSSATAEIPVLPAHALDALAASALRSALRAVLDDGQEVGQALGEAERHLWRLVKDGL